MTDLEKFYNFMTFLLLKILIIKNVKIYFPLWFSLVIDFIFLPFKYAKTLSLMIRKGCLELGWTKGGFFADDDNGWRKEEEASAPRERIGPVIESSGERAESISRLSTGSSWTANNINRATSRSHNGPLWRRVNARNINRERRRALYCLRATRITSPSPPLNPPASPSPHLTTFANFYSPKCQCHFEAFSSSEFLRVYRILSFKLVFNDNDLDDNILQ